MIILANKPQANHYSLYFTCYVITVSFIPLVFWLNFKNTLYILFIALSLYLITTGRDYYLFEFVILLTAGFLGAFCRLFIMLLLDWNIRKSNLIMERKKLLQSLHEQLKEKSRFQQLISSILTHDIRGPLQNINGLIELLDGKKLNEHEFKIQIGNLKHTSNKGLSVVNNSIALTKAIIQNTQIQKINLYDLVNEVIELHNKSAKLKNTELLNKIEKDRIIYSEPGMIKSILNNLITNAIKFTDNGAVNIYYREQDDHYIISVQDTGIGIEKDEFKYVLSENTFSKTGTSKEKGSGIGLKICSEILNLFNGDLFFESEKGKGSTFSFKLPYYKPPKNINTDNKVITKPHTNKNLKMNQIRN